MLEIARGFLRNELEAASRVPPSSRADSHAGDIFPESIYELIHDQIDQTNPGRNKTGHLIESPHGIEEYIWEARDERAPHVLADVFYAKPEIARKLCEMRPQLIPAFVHYLADEAHRYWQIEKSGAALNLGTEKLLHELFKDYQYVVPRLFRTLSNSP
jgi:hypothetical protein